MAESRLLPGRVHAHAETNQFISVNFTTIFRKLERIGLPYKNTQTDREGTQRDSPRLRPRFRFLSAVGGW